MPLLFRDDIENGHKGYARKDYENKGRCIMNRKVLVMVAAADSFWLIPTLSISRIWVLTSLGELNFEIIKQQVDEIVTASEASIVAAMRMIWERMKIVIEPSSALPLAVILENREKFAGKKIGIILSGGNVELSKLPFV